MVYVLPPLQCSSCTCRWLRVYRLFMFAHTATKFLIWFLCRIFTYVSIIPHPPLPAPMFCAKLTWRPRPSCSLATKPLKSQYFLCNMRVSSSSFIIFYHSSMAPGMHLLSLVHKFLECSECLVLMIQKGYSSIYIINIIAPGLLLAISFPHLFILPIAILLSTTRN